MNDSDGWTGDECGEVTLMVFYFLMAATAFLAASSRFSAAVMGRPLSVRILLASWTLVPIRHRQEKAVRTCNNKMTKNNSDWRNKVETDPPSALMLKTRLCERQRAPLEESLCAHDRWMELWVSGGKFNR